MRYAFLTIWLGAVCCAILPGQQPTPLEFEAASVKPAAPPSGDGRMAIMTGGRGGPGSSDPTRVTYTNAPLMLLITAAYDVKQYQVTGPAWLNQERYDVIAKIPDGATKEESRIMLQNLLAERFHLKLHKESKEYQGYELVQGKNGHKLKESSPEDAAFDQSQPMKAPPPPPPPGSGGLPKLDRPGMMMMMRMGGKGMVMHLTARAQPPSQLLNMISSQLNSPVIDKTGLTGKYDFTLDFAADGPPGNLMLPPPPMPPPGAAPPAGDNPEDLGQALPTALQQQLGLRLDAKKIPLDHLIIESADKVPTEN